MLANGTPVKPCPAACSVALQSDSGRTPSVVTIMSRIEHRTPPGLMSESKRVDSSPATGSAVPGQALSGLMASLKSPSSAAIAFMWDRWPSTSAIWGSVHATASPQRDGSSK